MFNKKEEEEKKPVGIKHPIYGYEKPIGRFSSFLQPARKCTSNIHEIINFYKRNIFKYCNGMNLDIEKSKDAIIRYHNLLYVYHNVSGAGNMMLGSRGTSANKEYEPVYISSQIIYQSIKLYNDIPKTVWQKTKKILFG